MTLGKIGKVLKSAGDFVGDVFNRATGQTQANQWQWDMWNAQNAYNTPLAQRQRLEAAGYNPMLLNSGGSTVAGNAGSMTAKSGSGISPFEILSAIANSNVALAQSDFINEQARQLRHDNNLNEGLPVKSSDNGIVAKLARLFGWATTTEQGADAVKGIQNTTKSLVQDVRNTIEDGKRVFAGALQKPSERVLSDELVKLRPGMRLDEAIKRSDTLKNKLKNAPSKKVWTGSRFGKYNDFAP